MGNIFNYAIETNDGELLDFLFKHHHDLFSKNMYDSLRKVIYAKKWEIVEKFL